MRKLKNFVQLSSFDDVVLVDQTDNRAVPGVIPCAAVFLSSVQNQRLHNITWYFYVRIPT